MKKLLLVMSFATLFGLLGANPVAAATGSLNHNTTYRGSYGNVAATCSGGATTLKAKGTVSNTFVTLKAENYRGQSVQVISYGVDGQWRTKYWSGAGETYEHTHTRGEWLMSR